jgi:hypothetical protein
MLNGPVVPQMQQVMEERVAEQTGHKSSQVGADFADFGCAGQGSLKRCYGLQHAMCVYADMCPRLDIGCAPDYGSWSLEPFVLQGDLDDDVGSSGG